MSRKINTQKRFPKVDYKYNNFLVSFLINRILKNGKKNLAKKIVYESFEFIELRTKKNPIFILEKAINNSRPEIQLKSKYLYGKLSVSPVYLTIYQSVLIAIKWLIYFSKKHSGKTMSLKLANELIEASKGLGNTIKKKEETHKLAEANKEVFDF